MLKITCEDILIFKNKYKTIWITFHTNCYVDNII